MSDDLDFDMEVVKTDSKEERSNGAQGEPDEKPTSGRGLDDLPEIERVPDDWELTTIGEVAESVLGGGTPSKSEESYWGGEIPWASVKDLDGITANSTEDYITEEGVENSATNLIPSGSIIISTRMTVGEAFMNLVDMAINQDLKAIRPDQSRSNTYFLTYALRSKDEYLKSLGRGTTVSGITTADLKCTHLSLPFLPEQRKIASVLSAVDQAIQTTEAIIEQAQRVKRGLMQDLFGKNDTGLSQATDLQEIWIGPKKFDVPKEWEATTIQEIGRVVTGDTPSTDEKENYGGDLPFVTPADLKDSKYVVETSRTLSEQGRQEAKPVPKGTVMMDCIGSDMGKVSISRREVTTNQQINSVVVKDDDYSSEFLYYHLLVLSDYVKAQAGQTATPIVNKGDFQSFGLLKPPPEDQKWIAKSLSNYDDIEASNQEYLDQLKRIKKGLMQDLLTGEVRTADKAIEVLDEVTDP